MTSNNEKKEESKNTQPKNGKKEEKGMDLVSTLSNF
jgi:hypothetical protein